MMSDQGPQPFDVIPDSSTPGVPPAGSLARVQGAKNQFHAFRVYNQLYVSTLYFPFLRL